MGSALYSLGPSRAYLNCVYGSLRPLLDQTYFLSRPINGPSLS